MTHATSITRRHDLVRLEMRRLGVDALLVTHLPNIRYLTGFVGTAGAVIVTGQRCELLVDFRYATAARDLAAALPAGAVTVHAVDRSYDVAIVARLRDLRALRIGIEAPWLSVKRFNVLSADLAAGAPLPMERSEPCPVLVATERVVERLRAIKDEVEVAALREGGRRLSAIARGVHELVAPGRTELEIAADLEAALRRAGFSRPAFETIVASGPNSALPHARPGARAVESGDAVVLDFGGVYDGYCVDLTRTVQLGAPSTALQRLYDAVSAAHDAAIAAVKPGVRPSAIDAAARDVLRARGLGDAFGHGTGHGLGLEVHEDPRIARETPGVPDDPVEAGMVFTIEPGAYVPGIGGVRIEDDVLVVAGGCEPLTDAPSLIRARGLEA
jgi:Xaa-Pro aminopeptidase